MNLPAIKLTVDGPLNVSTQVEKEPDATVYTQAFDASQMASWSTNQPTHDFNNALIEYGQAILASPAPAPPVATGSTATGGAGAPIVVVAAASPIVKLAVAAGLAYIAFQLLGKK